MRKSFRKIGAFAVTTALALASVSGLSALFAGCSSGENEGGGNTDITEKNLEPIVYEQSLNTMREGTNVNLVVPPQSSAVTGESLTAYVMLDTELDNYNYYVVDWGDGTWSYNGPYAYNTDHKVLGEVYHTYKKAGTYQVRAAGINLAEGELYGWTAPQSLTVTGSDWEGNMVKAVEPIASSQSGDDAAADKIADNDNETAWESKEAQSVAEEDYVGYLFDDYYTLDKVEVKIPDDVTIFPSNISIDYTTDGGQTWYMLPHYYYVLPNAVNYNIIMNFPNPKGATLVLDLDGIVANGLRIRSVMYPLTQAGEKHFSVSEMRVYGEKELLFFSSYDGYYNADLNNMWSIYGTAKTEPRMYNSLRGGATNVDPFRSGQTMTASVEWFEWNGDKLLWTDYDEALNIHVNSLKDAVYGGDGWKYDSATGEYVVDESEYDTTSGNDGYVWATESAPQHLGEQNHYTNNSTLILGIRDYLLMGNNTAGFLSSTNARGQSVLEKARKAADYMINTLNGRSGLMTIYDPRNDGTVHGLSSNYWDSLNCFGYNSAYENILFYRAVIAMGDIESYLGNQTEADYYYALSRTIKRVFNETFWDSEKGRYITSININGTKLDFGFTPLNFMAASCGLADAEQLQSIYDWVDGKRIIEGDDSTGEDIYAFKVSARSNTYAVENIVEDGLHYWWYNGHSYNDVLPGMWGEYGNQMQNGGTIFYTSYYVVSGRINLSTDNAISRFNAIMDEFHIDQLRRDPQTQWGGYQVSILGEFPESGLVPLTFLTGFIGVNPEVKGLCISANLPSDMTYAGVNSYHYGGREYSIEVNKELSSPEVKKVGDKYYVRLPAGKTWYITLENKLIEG